MFFCDFDLWLFLCTEIVLHGKILGVRRPTQGNNDQMTKRGHVLVIFTQPNFNKVFQNYPELY